MSRRFNPSKKDLSENPPTPENLLRGFHGRDVQNKKRFRSDFDSLANAFCIGKSDIIFYNSDKRDPKDPDGEGSQGFMKSFYHEQKPTSMLYVVVNNPSKLDPFVESLIEECDAQGISAKAKKQRLIPPRKLPNKLKVVQLGILKKVQLNLNGANIDLSFEGYDLYVWDDMKTLMGISKKNGVFDFDLYFIWISKHTKVNWRGIID